MTKNEIQKLLDKGTVTYLKIDSAENKSKYYQTYVHCQYIRDGKVVELNSLEKPDWLKNIEEFVTYWDFWFGYGLKHAEPEAKKLNAHDWVKKGIEHFEKLNNCKVVFFTIPS